MDSNNSNVSNPVINATKKHTRSPSNGKLKIPPLKSTATPSTPELPKRRIELSRSVNIKVKNSANDFDEYLIKFDDLVSSDLLGRGQFGTVKKMYHKESNLTFAVKMINDDLMSNESNDKRNSEIMDLEVPIKIGDGCPYLIKFYGALHAESYIWILTEVMDTSIDRFYVKVKTMELPMPELFISKLSYAVLSALDYMRKLTLMHRDIKPSNILINANGDIKVCDFGISGFTTNSVCTTFKGCQRYMPPEKIDTSLIASGYSAKADIWSLGISLIEIATGEHPFQNAKGFLGLIKSIVSNDPPKLDSTKFSSELCSFIDKCLIKNADDRSSSSELLKDPFIEKYLTQENDLELIKKVIDEIKKDKIDA